ncbi:MAG: hypothetical protein GX288_10280 [Clostridiales bacterium]|nr:hypothetical protein [Clostridiales bacterium]
MDENKINRQEASDYKNHISPSDISSFQEDRLNINDLEKFLEHIASCNFCSNLLAESMEKNMISAPVDMKANILNSAKSLNVQASRRVKDVSKRVQLLRYSLKVAGATIGALFLLYLTYKMPYYNYASIELPKEITVSDDEAVSFTHKIRNSMDEFGSKILDLSNNIMKTEVNYNDKKEK